MAADSICKGYKPNLNFKSWFRAPVQERMICVCGDARDDAYEVVEDGLGDERRGCYVAETVLLVASAQKRRQRVGAHSMRPAWML